MTDECNDRVSYFYVKFSEMHFFLTRTKITPEILCTIFVSLLNDVQMLQEPVWRTQ